jgi:hypothetical protein
VILSGILSGLDLAWLLTYPWRVDALDAGGVREEA